MSMLCNCCVREVLILARTWFAFGLPSKIGCDTHLFPSLPFLLYETLEVGRRWMGVTDLLPMVPVRRLSIACLHGLFLTTMSTRYTSTTCMYLSPILLSLQKLLCCSSVGLGVSFFVVLRTEHNLDVLILYLLYAHGLCSSDDGSWILQNMC
jgi:hypothetical protein